MKFPIIKMVFMGSLIAVGVGIACNSASIAPSTGQEANEEADADATSPGPTQTAIPDIYATIIARRDAATKADATPTPTAQETDSPIPTAIPTLDLILATVRPSVVRIDTDRGTGSGIIFQMGFPTPGEGNTGLVVTNYHVIEFTDSINILVDDSKSYTGEVLRVDPVHDLAVLTICCDQFQPLEFTEADDPPVGSTALAFGYPLGVEGRATIAEGIVSATQYENGQWIIQTDAAIDPGSSGGPLVSSSGAILGINTYRFEPTQDGQPLEGIGFAVSQKTLRERLPALTSVDPPVASTPVPTPTPIPLTYLLEGQRLYESGFFDSAVIEFTLAIEDGRDLRLAYAWRGRSNSELANYREAIADLSQALLQDPNDMDFYRWRGDSYMGLQIYPPAILDYSQIVSRGAIAIASDHQNLAYARFKNKEYWQAIDDYTQAILLEPTAGRFEFRGASYFQSGGEVLTNQFWSAISDFDQAIKMEPSASRYEQRGDTYDKLGLDTEAKSDWDQACALDSGRCK